MTRTARAYRPLRAVSLDAVRRGPLRLLLTLLPLAALSACSEADDDVPPYREDLVDLHTNALAQPARLVLDDGTQFAVRNPAGFGALKPDTVYRALALYTSEGGEAQLGAIGSVISPHPTPFSGQRVPTDPVTLVAAWRGGGYVNLRIDILTGGGAHRFAFVDRGRETLATGSVVQAVELYHDQNGDAEYYTRSLYLSCPLQRCAAGLRAGKDSVELRVNTYRGETAQRFPL